MKVKLLLKTLVLFSVLFLISQDVSARDERKGPVFIRVVDQTGAAVPKAKLLIWHCNGRDFFTTDDDGRFSMTFKDRLGCRVLRVKKVGYDTRGRNFLQPFDFGIARPGETSYERPHTIVIRKMEPEPEAIDIDPDWRFRKWYDDEPPSEPFSIFGNGDDLGKSGYVDLFVLPKCDHQKKEWTLSFWTTNVNCGIIATTNRVYVAPESGYRARVDVAKSDYLSPSFTLYLKTRPQGLYAMVPFREREIQANYGMYRTNLIFGCDRVYINPYGGRNLECDVRSCGRYLVEKGKTIWDVLKEGNIPPRIDVPARIENRRQWWKLEAPMEQISNQQYILRKKIEEICHKMKDRPQDEIDKALEPINREMKLKNSEYWKLREVRDALDDILPTLNLPPGMTEKDKYGKVDLELSYKD